MPYATCPECRDEAPARFECWRCGTLGYVEVDEVPEVVSAVVGEAAYDPGGRDEGHRRAEAAVVKSSGKIPAKVQAAVNAAAIEAIRNTFGDFVSAYHVYSFFTGDLLDQYDGLGDGQKKSVISQAMANAAKEGWIEHFYIQVGQDTFELLDVTKRPTANAGNQRVWRINGNDKKPAKITFAVKP